MLLETLDCSSVNVPAGPAEPKRRIRPFSNSKKEPLCRCVKLSVLVLNSSAVASVCVCVDSNNLGFPHSSAFVQVV